jgi:glycosyltransferase involved in cell wall biosynthesis
MKILLIANYVPDGQQSMLRYSALLKEGLTAAGHRVRVIRPPVQAGKWSRGPGGKWLGYVDKMLLFPGLLRCAVESDEIVHICDHSNAFYMQYLPGQPHVVTCHDLLAVRSALGEIRYQRTGWSGRQLQRMILDGLRRARHIVCVSDATRADVLRLAASGNAEVSRIYNGLHYPYAEMDAPEAADRLRKCGIAPDRPFVLHVGGNQWYKNRLGVLKIFVHLLRLAPGRTPALIMAGKPWTDEMRQFVRLHDLGRSVFEFADAAEEDLRALYSRAEALLFPSLEEGFGWPIAEAQACGCPVVTSNRAPMTEVGGDAAVYIDPLDHESAALAVARAIGSRAATREAGLRNAARFRTSAMIDAYVSLYERILEANPHSGIHGTAMAGRRLAWQPVS